MPLSSARKLTMGHRFDREREVVSRIYLNYFYILLFSCIVIFLYASGENLLPVTYHYHASSEGWNRANHSSRS